MKAVLYQNLFYLFKAYLLHAMIIGNLMDESGMWLSIMALPMQQHCLGQM